MTRIQPQDQDNEQEAFEPLTAQQAAELRKRQPLLSVWRVVGVQALLGLLVAWLVWLVSGRMSAVYSAGYGALAVIIPAALFARGLTSRVASENVGAAVFGFFLWEMVKIGLTVAMLLAAPRLVIDLSWPAMLVGLIVTMKVYWVALGFRKVFYPVNPT
ncbi:ATP synthase subunit I [Limnohabitans sp.]|uniref:ATP synthase subunit I n=1 Tax=Limnohabitans sp. TaxID=1907725 RepID=UPI002FDD94A5